VIGCRTHSAPSIASRAKLRAVHPFDQERIGALYEAKGQRGLALRHYDAYVALWKDADRALHARVMRAQEAVTPLIG
jgi:hypothetical protein